jgi:hypothetical protein
MVSEGWVAVRGRQRTDGGEDVDELSPLVPDKLSHCYVGLDCGFFLRGE